MKMIDLLFDEQLNTGECSHALYLGCRDCDECVVDEYEKRIEEEIKNEEKEMEMLLDEETKWVEEQFKKEELEAKKLYENPIYEGSIILHRWNYNIFNIILEYIIKEKDIKILSIDFLGRGYVNYALWGVHINKYGHYICEPFFL